MNDLSNKTLVKNELLTYAFHYVHQCTAESAAKAISDFYTGEEIVEAIKCLITAFPDCDAINDDFRRKRTSAAAAVSDTNRNKLALDLIVKAVVPLADTPDREVIFCAMDLSKMPRHAPEEINISSLLVRIQNLEAKASKIDQIESTCVSNTADIRKLQSQTQYGARPKTPYNPLPPLPLMPQNMASGDELLAASAKQQLLQPIIQEPEASYASKVAASVLRTGQTKGVMNKIELTPKSSKWLESKRECRRLVKEANNRIKTVTGSDTSNRNNIKAAGINRTIYLSKVDKDYTEDDVKSMLAGNDINMKYIRQINGRHGLGLKKSFMIVIPEKDFDTVMNEEFWPEGLECREWLNRDQLKAITENKDDQTT